MECVEGSASVLTEERVQIKSGRGPGKKATRRVSLNVRAIASGGCEKKRDWHWREHV